MTRTDALSSDDRLGEESLRNIAAWIFVLGGRVQGVGFRPFVQRLATTLDLAGDVRNLSGQVLIHVEGCSSALETFRVAVIRDAPPLSRPVLQSGRAVPMIGFDGFRIAESQRSAAAEIHIPPDQSICPDCLAELTTPGDRRFRYPFINCTACGPRYTIIDELPYDRSATSMASFAMCPSCRADYESPADRRFHAEPVACPDCGPSLTFVGTDNATRHGTEASIAEAVATLRRGNIVAIRGIGGYHFLCDAANDRAVTRLRERKRRPEKPLAVIFPMVGTDGLDSVRRSAAIDPVSARQLNDPARPIVLVPRRSDCPLSDWLTPGIGDLGVMLPYSPLHHILIDAFGAPLVATSGNMSGEPVITSRAAAERRLGLIADAFLHHDREILRPADDPVVRRIDGEIRHLRLGRGTAPLEMSLPFLLKEPLLAVGGQGKVTVALGIGDRVIISPHIGELDTPRGFDQMVRLTGDLQRLYRAKPTAIVCDLHPGFAGTRWALRQGPPVIGVQHHAAHASALAAEHPDVTRWLVFAWDGVGYGHDGTLWGGEALLGASGDWSRVASFRTFRPPGGDLAARAPWRSAAALLWDCGYEYTPLDANGDLIRKVWQFQLNAQQTSAVGRLFDAAAAIIGGGLTTTFEGQGAMQLEHLAETCKHGTTIAPVELPMEADDQGVLRCDWSALLPTLLDQTHSAADRALWFHVSMAAALVAQVNAIGATSPFDAVGLTGGVFQNRMLAELVVDQLRGLGKRVELPRLVPPNDGGLAFGQVVEAAAQRVAR